MALYQEIYSLVCGLKYGTLLEICDRQENYLEKAV